MNNSIFKFIIAGSINTLVSYLIFLVIFTTTKSVALALILASMMGTTSSYLLNRYWVWKKGTAKSKYNFLFFQLIIIFVNWLVLHLISLTYFPREVAQGFLYFLIALAAYKFNKKIF